MSSSTTTTSSAAAITRRRRALETAIATHCGSSQGNSRVVVVDNDQTTTTRLTDSAATILVPCLEEFLHILANELAANNPLSSDAKKQVSTRHVVAALNKMGFEQLATEASLRLMQQEEINQQQPTKESASRKTAKKRKNEFSQEQADAQEALLAASRQKMGSG